MAQERKPLIQTIDPDNVRELFISGPGHAVVGQSAGGERFLILTFTSDRLRPANLFELNPSGQATVDQVVVARLVFGIEAATEVARTIARAVSSVDPRAKPGRSTLS
jgi:hypothetical protein